MRPVGGMSMWELSVWVQKESKKGYRPTWAAETFETPETSGSEHLTHPKQSVVQW